jgi:alkanesulfonate monooxygenase SsuD/methylene tetrahydromethanopterin reductase-like flavin-dependent oxidoreductase (luciferase family)
VEFGINFFPVVDPASKGPAPYYEESLRLVVAAEAAGFAHVQTVEHYCSPYGGYSPDPVLFLTAAAMRTSTIRLITGAVIAAFEHPVKLAARLAVLDNLSRGRLDIGFGRGFLPREFEMFGYSMDESRARFQEGIEACRRLWTEPNVIWDGKFHSFGPVTLQPRPYTTPHPRIYIASASTPDSCAAAGRDGYGIQVVPSVVTPERLQEMVGRYREAWADAGHPEQAPRVQIKYTCYVADDHDTAMTMADTWERNYISMMAQEVAALAEVRSTDYPGYETFADKVKKYSLDKALADNKVLVGTHGEVTAQLAAMGEQLGSDICVSLQFNPGAMPEAQSQRSFDLFVQHVMPQFAETAPAEGVR